MQLRLFFPLPSSSQLVLGVNSTYSNEIKKLRSWASNYFIPYIQNIQLNKKYPYKLKITYFAFFDNNICALSILSAYIVHLLECNFIIQSMDYRIIPELQVEIKHIHYKDKEGCELLLEKIKH